MVVYAKEDKNKKMGRNGKDDALLVDVFSITRPAPTYVILTAYVDVFAARAVSSAMNPSQPVRIVNHWGENAAGMHIVEAWRLMYHSPAGPDTCTSWDSTQSTGALGV